ncbi:hypothetical protein K1719_016038 [Acacia pycnantha]|nr:hypothetical protein K1719_016038 [Acacia pycnantha]
MDLSSHKRNPASSSLSGPRNSGMNNSVPMSQDFPSGNSQAPGTYPFFGFSTNENGLDFPYSEIYPIILPQNEDDYIADNALMDMFKDIPLIQQIRSQENYQKERQESDTKQVSKNNGEIVSEKFNKMTLNGDNNYSKIQSSPTPTEVFGHSQQLINHQLSSPANKRQKTSSINECNTPDFASNNFNSNQRTSSSVKTTRVCIKQSCSKGCCTCYPAKVGCSSKNMWMSRK